MPNWCSNRVRITHPSRSVLEAVVVAAGPGGVGLGEFLRPTPPELLKRSVEFHVLRERTPEEADLISRFGHADWYGWRLANWGTKWDVKEVSYLDETNHYHALDASPAQIVRDLPNGGAVIEFAGETAWSPPVALYQYAETQGYKIEAVYIEEANGICGAYSDGEDSEYGFPDPTDSEAVAEFLEAIPAQLREEYNLDEVLRDTAEEFKEADRALLERAAQDDLVEA
jgi:hypothetical protein